MERPATSARAASIWQKLAILVAFLAVAIYVTHAVAAEGFLPPTHVHAAAHAGPSGVADDTAVDPGVSHGHSSMVSEKQYGSTGDGVLACCGKACLSALLPDEGPRPDCPWNTRSKFPGLVAILSGRGPDGLRRPPWLLDLI